MTSQKLSAGLMNILQLDFLCLLEVASKAPFISISSLQIYMVHKVSLHTVAKVFSLWERIFGLLQCTFVEIPKLVFYSTSCQLNWSLILSTKALGSYVKISLLLNTSSSTGLVTASIFNLLFRNQNSTASMIVHILIDSFSN